VLLGEFVLISKVSKLRSLPLKNALNLSLLPFMALVLVLVLI
jgi:hypothetical protein